MERKIFGPVPSRRLGRSLGVNNIPYKCTYSCIYCQVGKAIKMQINRQEFYNPEELVGEVKALLSNIQDKVTETMLVKGVNDSPEELKNTAWFIKSFAPDIAYLAVPTRPPAFKKVEPSDEATVNTAYHIFREYIENVELLTGYEGNAFASTGNFSDDLLSITAVHPMREDAVMELLKKTGGDEQLLTALIEHKKVEKLQFNEHFYYLRKFTR